MALAASRARLCAAATAVAEPAAAATTAKAMRAVRGEVNMPSRAIAAVLLRSEEPVPNRQLFVEAHEYGLLKSHRHFKHVLKMMKAQRRVQVIPGPPVCFRPRPCVVIVVPAAVAAGACGLRPALLFLSARLGFSQL